MGFKVGDVVTSNGQDRPILTYVNAEQNYGEAKYSDGFSFRVRLSDYRMLGKYEPANPCPKHKAFESDNCPGCGTADRLC